MIDNQAQDTPLHFSNSKLYQDISLESYYFAQISLDNSKTSQTPDEYSDFIFKARKYSIISIIFSALSLEAFINSYALRNMSKKKYEEEYRFNSLYLKWRNIPQQIVGKAISDTNLEKLKTLVALRNSLVHSHPYELPQDDVELQQLSTYLVDDILEGAREALETITLIAINLNEIDPNVSNYVLVSNQDKDS